MEFSKLQNIAYELNLMNSAKNQIDYCVNLNKDFANAIEKFKPLPNIRKRNSRLKKLSTSKTISLSSKEYFQKPLKERLILRKKLLNQKIDEILKK